MASNSQSEMRLLVTGGAGFIGSNVVHALLPRPEISRLVVLDCLTYAGHRANLQGVEDNPKFAFAEIDLRNAEAVTRLVHEEAISNVMHLAAESHVDRSITGPAAFIETNVMGTFNLLEACRELWGGEWTGRRFLHVSTDEVFGSLGATGAFSETSQYQPNSPYSASKAGADHLVRAYHHTYGFPSVISNCSNNFGPYQFPEKLIPLTIHRAVSGQSIPVYGDGSNVRDWLFVEDHVDALWLALTRGELGESYNVGGDNEWPNLRVVETICDLVDQYLDRPEGAAREFITFVKDRPGHDFRYAIDARKIKREFGWAAGHEFRTALKATVAWYLNHQGWVAEVQQAAQRRLETS
jgi:dTDP-glucose 4,6-dehydratase